MKPVKHREAAKLFRKLRMSEDRRGHHVYGHLELDGKLVVTAHFSHGPGNRDMKKSASSNFKKSFYLKERPFWELVKCTFKTEDYYQYLRDEGHV